MSSLSTILIAALLITTIVLVAVVLFQKKEIEELKKPKFGFLGKPLYSAVAVVAILGVVGSVYFSSISLTPGDVDVSDPKEIIINVKVEITEEISEELYKVKLNAIPLDKGVPYGTSTYKLFWKVYDSEGMLVNEHFDPTVSIQEVGGFTTELPTGNYKVIFIVEKDKTQFTTSSNFSIQ